MDIQRWLNETELPEQPPSPAKRRDPAPRLPVKEFDQAPLGNRRRKPSTSDSSLLESPPQIKKAQPLAPQKGSDEGADESACSDASRSSTSSESSTSSDPYARRPRRKTRIERYEPASKHIKERGTHSRRHRKGEPSRTKRKRKRKVDNVGIGTVQGFQAKNVSKDRLTLKPPEKLGLFSKGRASTPVKGRGLPDLVFSEMKFLQSHTDRPEAVPKSNLPKKKRKKDPVHAKEEAISAYFTSVRPALVDKELDIQAKEGPQKQLQGIDRRENGSASVVDNPVPTVEWADQASYLGFGSRGPRHESESYISWSESMRAPSAVPARSRIASTVRSGQLDSIDSTDKVQDEGNTKGEDALHLRPALPTVAPCMTEGSGGRFQVSSLVPANDSASRSHSLPQLPSTPHRIHPVNQVTRFRNLERSASPSSIPLCSPGLAEPQYERPQPSNNGAPTIPKGSALAGEVQDSFTAVSPTADPETRPSIRKKADPRASSNLGRILEDCNAAFHEHRQATAPLRMGATGVTTTMAPSPKRATSHRGPYPTIQRIPTVRFADTDEIYAPRMPMTTAVSVYEQHQNRQIDVERRRFEEEHNLQEVLTNGHYAVDEEQSYSVYNWEEDADFSVDNGESDSWREDHFAEAAALDNGRSSTNSRGHAINSAYTDDAVVKPGFWRPHKLY